MRTDRIGRMWNPALLFASVLVLSGCGGESGLPPEVDAFRAALADPGRYPIRKGTEIDAEALKSALEDFARTNHDALEKHFRQTVERLPEAEPPAAPAYAKFCECDESVLKGLLETRGSIWAVVPDAEMVFRRDVGMFLPVMMHQGGMENSKMGAWVSFLSFAKPTLRRKRDGEDRLTLIGEYGKADILVLNLTRGALGWIPVGVSWWRPASR